jgi:spore maturation protein CgeB
MATKTLLFCPKSEHYGKIFRDGFNCVIFNEDLSDFEEILEYVLNNEKETRTIVRNAYHDALNNHTYDNRIDELLRIVFKGTNSHTTSSIILMK